MSEWWKVSPEELRRLLLDESAGSPSIPPASPTEASGAPPHDEAKKGVASHGATQSDEKREAGTAPPATAGIRSSCYTPLHFMLARTLPRLWAFAQRQPEAADARELHRKLRELIAWVLAKDRYAIESNVATTYRLEQEDVHGRLELLVRNREGAPVLAIETDWTTEPASLRKLEVWHDSGVPTLWILGAPAKAAGLSRFRSFANRTLRQSTRGWLAIYHLEHGWVRTSASKRS